MNVIIFKTSVRDRYDLTAIKNKMDNLLGAQNWSFALEDEDKILRVVSAKRCVAAVTRVLKTYGFFCEEMPYSLDEFNV